MSELNTIILAAGKSSRFLESKPKSCKITHKSLCLIGNTTIIGNLIELFSRLGEVYVVSGGCSYDDISDEFQIVKSMLDYKTHYPIRLVYNSHYNQDSNMWSLRTAEEAGANLSDSLIVDGDTYLDDHVFNQISYSIYRHYENNRVYTTSLKRSDGEWRFIPKLGNRVAHIEFQPTESSNISTGITRIHSKELSKYLARTTPYPKYWDQYYVDMISQNKEPFYLYDFVQGVISEIDTYPDYTNLLKVLDTNYEGGKSHD
jgi:CTP:phosphocholine cytidylyltransferase-like protein